MSLYVASGALDPPDDIELARLEAARHALSRGAADDAKPSYLSTAEPVKPPIAGNSSAELAEEYRRNYDLSWRRMNSCLKHNQGETR